MTPRVALTYIQDHMEVPPQATDEERRRLQEAFSTLHHWLEIAPPGTNGLDTEE